MKKIIIAGSITALLLVVVFVGLGIADARADTRPDQVVERFYQNWIKVQAEGENAPFERKLHEKSTYVTESFGREVGRGQETQEDTILCGTTDPKSFAIEQAVEREDGSSASVIFSLSDVIGRVVLVPDHRGWWRIDEVDCQKRGA